MFKNNIEVLSILLGVLIMGGCSGKTNVSSATTYQANVTSDAYTGVTSSPYPLQQTPVKRIITQRANIRVEVESIDEAKLALEALLETNGGHIINAHIYEDNYNASAKVPSSKLLSTLEEIANLGDKISQSVSQNDVTNQFVDNEARLKNLMLFREKMQKLLTQTTHIEEILKIERELGRVQTEIDSIQGRLKYLKDAVALSPIKINFEEKTVYGPLGYVANGIWWVTKKLFVIK
jgi:hypothetical protein